MNDGDIVSANIDRETDDICDGFGKVVRSVTRWIVTVTRAYPSYRPDQRTKVVAVETTFESALQSLVRITEAGAK